MNRLIDKYGNKGAQDIMQLISFILGIIIILMLGYQISLNKETNSLLSDLTKSEFLLTSETPSE